MTMDSGTGTIHCVIDVTLRACTGTGPAPASQTAPSRVTKPCPSTVSTNPSHG